MEGATLFPKYEKPLKKAFYNGIALLLLCACSFFAWGSFKILEPFLKPLFWALLCGSVLHPFKYKLSSNFKSWIIFLENTDFNPPLIIGIVSCPAKIIIDLSEFVGDYVQKQWKKIVCGISLIVLSVLAYNYIPQFFICVSWKFLKYMLSMLEFSIEIFENVTLILTILVGFLVSLTFLWEPAFEKHYVKVSYFVWFALSAHIASYVYHLRLPVLIAFQFIVLSKILLSDKHHLKSDLTRSINEEEIVCKKNASKVDEVEAIDDIIPVSPQLESQKLTSDKIKQFLVSIGLQLGNNTSDIYIYWVSTACIVTLILQSGWIPYFITVLLLVYIVRSLCRYFGITAFIASKLAVCQTWISSWYQTRKHVLTPITYFNTIFGEVRTRVLSTLRESSDSAASIMVILALVFFVTFGSTFLVFQAYTEGVYMVKVGGSVINQTVVHNPELTQLLPEGWEQKLDSVLNNAYTYGRQALSKLVRNMLNGLGDEKIEELEARALEVWDRVYQAWMMNAIERKTTVGPKVTSLAVSQTWDRFVDTMQKTPELVSMNALAKLAQDNMAMLTSGLESVWELIRGNASLVLSALLTVLTLVFSHSFAVLNFFISMIVFLTALFYLLCSSRELYKPAEVITAISPVFGSRLAFAMENAVKEVLTASFKLALFYGMWTWLIHNLFQMNIVYIPSVLAAMLAVVPALGTYWACLPAVLDLWLAQGRKIHAITLALCQFFPTLFVDATIYTEINEGHPYLTGLSVAGGLFCMGIEGAIIGPLILCCLYVVISMSSSIMRDATTPSTPVNRRVSTTC